MIKVTDEAVKVAVEYLGDPDVVQALGDELAKPGDNPVEAQVRIALEMAVLDMRWRPWPDDPWWRLQVRVQRMAGGVEWSERWGAWPHCNGQARCWMHLDKERRWCECRCRWCRVARKVRRDGDQG